MFKNNYKIIRKPGKSRNILATIIISKKYIDNWNKYFYKNWIMYAKKYDLGLIIFTDFIDNSTEKKKPTWQKLLIGSFLKKELNYLKINNICYLDSDILINIYRAPNIFNFHKKEKLTVVSQYKNLPFTLNEILRRISFFRNVHYSKRYPLDSAIFMKPHQIFQYHKFKRFDDYFCAGLFIFNMTKYSKLMANWYYKYSRNFHTLTLGDEPVLNYEFQNNKNLNWIDYKFQAIWSYEMAWKYPFLYGFGKKNIKLQKQCVSTSLFENYFLHFAGSWPESKMYKLNNDFKINNDLNEIKDFLNYMKKKIYAIPKGIIKF
jgi:hypothetical protein